MKICELYRSKTPVFSFEIFPPKRQFDFDVIEQTIDELEHLNPDFISVTYGAGGSTKGKTLEIASLLKNNFNIETVAHLTCVSATKTEIIEIADELEKRGIENILALRGDIPADPNFKFPHPLHYRYATDLLQHLAHNYNFCLGGAFYPEGHTEAASIEDDYKFIKQKVKIGADFLISQMFFDNQFFYSYRKKLRKDGLNTPLVAGIFPITNAKQIWRMSALCGCSIPGKLSKIIARHVNNPTRLKAAGIKYAIHQIQDLIEHEVDGIHLYTMNKPDVAKEILSQISY